MKRRGKIDWGSFQCIHNFAKSCRRDRKYYTESILFKTIFYNCFPTFIKQKITCREGIYFYHRSMEGINEVFVDRYYRINKKLYCTLGSENGSNNL